MLCEVNQNTKLHWPNAHIHLNAPEYSFQFLRMPRDPQEVSCFKQSPLLQLQLTLLFVDVGLEAQGYKGREGGNVCIAAATEDSFCRMCGWATELLQSSGFLVAWVMLACE